MITLRLVHGLPHRFHPHFGGIAAGVGVLEGQLSIATSISGAAAGTGSVLGTILFGFRGNAAGQGVLQGDVTLTGSPSFFPSLDFSDARNSGYVAAIGA